MIGATSITQDQKLIFPLKARPVWVSPPLGNAMSRKFRGVIGGAHINITLLVSKVIDAVRDRQGLGLTEKIVTEDLMGLFAPTAAFVEKVADQFFLLAIDKIGRAHV